MPTHTRRKLGAAGVAALALPLLGLVPCLSGCHSDEPGYSKTVEKKTVDTPTAKTTTTETKVKSTTVTPPP